MEMIEHTLERNGCCLHYWIGGKEAAPWVIFTHGATVDHHEWDATLPLVSDRYRVLAWDVRGHGLSRPAPFDLSMAVEDLLALLDTLNIRQATLVGHSMGGNLAQEFVFHHPERVKAMVFLDCTWNFQKLTSMETFMLGLAKPIFELYPYKTLVNQSLMMTATSKESQELLRASMGSLTKPEFIQIMMATSLCLHYEPDYKIGKPLLLMVGENDQTGNIRKVMPLWAKAEPDSEFTLIPRAKHAANLDQPELFHKALLDFLQRRVSA